MCWMCQFPEKVRTAILIVLAWGGFVEKAGAASVIFLAEGDYLEKALSVIRISLSWGAAIWEL